MAIVKGPLHSEIASGNCGDLCYSRYRGRAVVRAAWSGIQTSTTDQLALRARMTTVSQYWKTLTNKQRNSWKEYAQNLSRSDRLGDYRNPSGYNEYIRRNMLLFRQGISTILEDPANDEGVYIWRVRAESWAAGIYVICEKAQNVMPDCAGWQFWRAGPFESEGRHPIEGEWRYKNRTTTTWLIIDTDVVALKWYWYRVRTYINSGDVGNWWEVQKQRHSS